MIEEYKHKCKWAVSETIRLQAVAEVIYGNKKVKTFYSVEEAEQYIEDNYNDKNTEKMRIETEYSRMAGNSHVFDTYNEAKQYGVDNFGLNCFEIQSA